MAERGSTDVTELATMLDGYEYVDVRMALVAVAGGWQVAHGEVTLDAAEPIPERTWRYAAEIFLERRIPGQVVAALLREEPQDLCELKVSAPPPVTNGFFERLAGQRMWSRLITPWPRTEWTVSSVEATSTGQGGVLVGDGPAFLDFAAAFSSFFYGAAPSSSAGHPGLWRIIQLDRRAWLHLVTIASDALVAVVKGTQLTGVSLELSTPTSRLRRAVGRTGRLRLRLPTGLPDSSLLMLRRDVEWLDYRYFATPRPGRERDLSVVWDEPSAELGILVAGGEGPFVEFKQEVPVNDSSKKRVLKTVAAFASGDGGTVLFGIDDDAQAVGINSATLDRQMVAVASMIRDSITPEPVYDLRVAELDGRTLLLIEVAAGGRWFALNPAKPEFYVRRGASTVPARLNEIAARFGHQQSTPLPPW